MLLERDGYRLHRGNSLDLLKSLPDASVDAFVTDPPYGIDLKIGTQKPGKNTIRGDGRLEAQLLWKAWVPEAHRVARPDTAHVVFGTWKCPWMLDVLRACFDVKGCIVWDKKLWGLGHYVRPRT